MMAQMEAKMQESMQAEIDTGADRDDTYPLSADEEASDSAQTAPPEELTDEEDLSTPSDGINTRDYAEIAREDISELKMRFPELQNINDLTELKNPLRYAALRDLGLSAEEAYLATGGRAPTYDNRAHLTKSVPGGASLSREMSRGDYDMAREIFSELSDAEIRKLYRKVTK